MWGIIKSRLNSILDFTTCTILELCLLNCRKITNFLFPVSASYNPSNKHVKSRSEINTLTILWFLHIIVFNWNNLLWFKWSLLGLFLLYYFFAFFSKICSNFSNSLNITKSGNSLFYVEFQLVFTRLLDFSIILLFICTSTSCIWRLLI